MARKKEQPSISNTGAGPKGQRVEHPIEQRSPNNQATGGYDPEDYHGSGPIPVGTAPIHPESPAAPGLPMGVDLSDQLVANPGGLPHAEAGQAGIDEEALGDSVTEDEAMKKASKEP